MLSTVEAQCSESRSSKWYFMLFHTKDVRLPQLVGFKRMRLGFRFRGSVS